MVEVLEFVFRDVWTFLGSALLLLIACWGVSNFGLVKIFKNNEVYFDGNENEIYNNGERS